MDRVSCRTFRFLKAAAARIGMTDEQLFEGLAAAKVVDDPEALVSWDEYATCWNRLAARLPNEEALREVAFETVTSLQSASTTYQPLLEFCTDAVALYELIGCWAAPAALRCIKFGARSWPDGTVSFTCELRAGLTQSRAFFFMLEGGLAAVPRFIGLEPSTLKRVTLTGRTAEWLITPATHQRAEPSPSPLVQELFSQQAQLASAFDALAASSKDFQDALEAMPLLVGIHEHGELSYVNSAFAAFFGRARETLQGVQLESLFAPHVREPLKVVLGPRVTGWTRLEHGVGGQLKSMQARSGGVVSFGGRARTLFLASETTSEELVRKRAERSESTLSTVLGALPDLVLRFGEDLKLLSVHGGAELAERRALTGMVGLTLPELQERLGIAGSPASNLVLENLRTTLRTGEPITHAHRRPDPMGRQRELLVRYVPLEGEALVITHDRTQQLADEKRLQVAERMASLGELAAGVAHEVNNPLTIVLANIEMLKEATASMPGASDVKEMLAELEEGCRRIRETTARMREFSLVQPRSEKAVPVLDLVDRADRMTRTELRYRARLEVDVEPGLEVWGDPNELVEVLVNLLANAAQAMPEGAGPESHHVWVAAWREGGSAVLEVADDGQGIPAHVLPRIFDPFFTTRSRRAGAGLGLAICHRIVTAHSGTVEASSAAGRTRLTVRLPLAPVKQDLAHAGPGAERKARVLVVDDEPGVGRTIKRALSRHEVTIVQDGRAAFSQLREGDLPDLVLCDLMMPGFTGMELYAALQRARPETLPRVAFISGGTFTSMAADFLRDHPVSVIHKPFDDGQLETLVQRALEREIR
jgi:signal transduction histidine kinase/PAS domain-containing protein